MNQIFQLVTISDAFKAKLLILKKGFLMKKTNDFYTGIKDHLINVFALILLIFTLVKIIKYEWPF